MATSVTAVAARLTPGARRVGVSSTKAPARLGVMLPGALTPRYRQVGLVVGRCNRGTGVVRASERDPMEEATEAARSANDLPEGVTPEDLKKFYTLVDSKTWEEVQGKAIELVQTGELTEGVVKAGEAVLAEATKRQEDPRILGSLQDAVGLLASAMDIVKAPPGLRLADECSNVMIEKGSVEAAKPAVLEMLRAAFDDPSVEVTHESLLNDVEGFLENIESQEKQSQKILDKMKQDAANAEEITQMIDYCSQRERAKKNLIALRGIVVDM